MQLAKKSYQPSPIIVVVLLLAAAVRIINSSTWTIWTDEGASIYTASDPHISAIVEKLTINHHPPLYFVVLGAWEQIAGESRIALRLLTILGGVLTTALVYRLGKDEFGHEAALIAALLFAVSDLTIHYAQQVRHYGWLVLAVAMMALTFTRCLRRPSVSNLTAYALSIAFMIYTQYLGLLVLALQGVVGLFGWRAPLRDKTRLIGAWLAALALSMPWLVVTAQHVYLLLSEHGLATRPGVAQTEIDDLTRLFNLLTDNQPALMVGVFALAVWQIIQNHRQAGIGDNLRVVPKSAHTGAPPQMNHVYLVLAGGGLFALMVVMHPLIRVLTPRTLVYLTPALAVVCGYGFMLLPSRARVLLLSASVAFSLANQPIIQPRMAYDRAAHTIAAEYSPGDLIILETGFDDNAFRYELALALPKDPPPHIIRTLPWVDTRREVVPVFPQVRADIDAHTRVWVIEWLQPSQVAPELANGYDGFRRVIAHELGVGAQYRDLFGDNTIRADLYARPDESQPARVYGDVFTLHSVLMPDRIHPGDSLHIDLWWSARQQPMLDYSVGVFLLDESGSVRAEHQGPPGTLPTSQWTPDDLIFDRHTLALPPDLPPGTYQVAINAYWYGDKAPLLVDGDPLAVVGMVDIANIIK